MLMTTKRMLPNRHRLGLLAVWISAAILNTTLSAQEPAVRERAPRIVLGSGSGICIQSGPKTYHGLLVREMLRQSLLMAAREELQLHVRDVTIGEATSAEVNWELACSPGNPNLLELLRGKAPSQDSVWQHPVQLPPDNLRYELLLAGLEKYSRSIFPKVLKEDWPPSKISADKPTSAAAPSVARSGLGFTRCPCRC
ncbi:hypothetical protein ETAA8_12960 [Anatilimnocola aggregata]|uniref:Uncharacterized protein n=1 Tax=Anatilimnocola aggregata TaxID=2528021 RepID=A0A517Y7L0_9BACT|nr:hypothetical protein [Anatilimnocola aggregata]QDU26221.1 hypothetical protein ETAA8_12960 [Anatilimnocola aggregata]